MTEYPTFADPPCAGKTNIFYPPDYLPRTQRDLLERQAKGICADCPYIEPCRGLGVSNEVFGVWGGYNGQELAVARRSAGIRIARSSVWMNRHKYCGTEAGFQIVFELGITCDICAKAHEMYVEQVLELDPYQLEGNHGSCGKEVGYQNLRRRSILNGVPANERKVWCPACRRAHSQEGARRIREKRAAAKGMK